MHDALLEAPEVDDALAAATAGDTLVTLRRHWMAAAERYSDRLDAESAMNPPESGTP